MLVTGAAGSIGAEFISRLGNEAIAVDNSEVGLFEIKGNPTVLGDIKKPDFIYKYAPDVVIHTAAYKHVPFSEHNVESVIDNNVNGTTELLKACGMAGVKTFLFVSTDKAADPTSTMGLTKALGERLVMSYAPFMQTTVVRFGNVIGSSGSVYRLWADQLMKGQPLTVTDKRCTRYFIDLEEAIDLSLLALECGSGTFTFDMGEPKSVYEIAKSMSKNIKIIGLRPGEKLTETLTSQHETRAITAHPKIWRINGVHG